MSSDPRILLVYVALSQVLFVSHGLSQPDCSTCVNTLEMINGEYHCRYCNPENFGAACSVSEQFVSEGTLISLGLLYSCIYHFLESEYQINFSEHTRDDVFSEMPLEDALHRIKGDIRENMELLKKQNLDDCSVDDSSLEADTFINVIEEILKVINGIESVTTSIGSELSENALAVHNKTSHLNLICIFEFNANASESDFYDSFSPFQNNDSAYVTIVGQNLAPIITLPVTISTSGYGIVVGSKTFCFSGISFYQLLMIFFKKLKSVAGRKNICCFHVYLQGD